MLDVEQAFDRIWFPGLLLKLRDILPPSYYLFNKSYLENRTFATKVGTEISEIHPINSGVPQGAISSPTLFNIYTADQPSSPHTYDADYVDDKLLISIHENHDTASQQLQTHLNSLLPWYNKWRIKLNESKCCHTTFTLRKKNPPSVFINHTVIPTYSKSKYLGLTIDRRLTWSPHIYTKKLAVNQRLRALQPLINKNTKTNLHSKLIIYKSLIKPMWSYGIVLWGAAKISINYKPSNLKPYVVS